MSRFDKALEQAQSALRQMETEFRALNVNGQRNSSVRDPCPLPTFIATDVNPNFIVMMEHVTSLIQIFQQAGGNNSTLLSIYTVWDAVKDDVKNTTLVYPNDKAYEDTVVEVRKMFSKKYNNGENIRDDDQDFIRIHFPLIVKALFIKIAQEIAEVKFGNKRVIIIPLRIINTPPISNGLKNVVFLMRCICGMPQIAETSRTIKERFEEYQRDIEDEKTMTIHKQKCHVTGNFLLAAVTILCIEEDKERRSIKKDIFIRRYNDKINPMEIKKSAVIFDMLNWPEREQFNNRDNFVLYKNPTCTTIGKIEEKNRVIQYLIEVLKQQEQFQPQYYSQSVFNEANAYLNLSSPGNDEFCELKSKIFLALAVDH
uniref:Tyrosine-protein phosphatase domain-containing protein n=1 Tax=Panagrellus redivivus TaxID=6233 RepID=A0A7E4VY23_PANRE